MQSNPYQSPGQIHPGSLSPGRPTNPTSVTVFGILNLIFGAMGLCGTAASFVVMFFMPQNPNAPNPVLDLMANVVEAFKARQVTA